MPLPRVNAYPPDVPHTISHPTEITCVPAYAQSRPNLSRAPPSSLIPYQPAHSPTDPGVVAAAIACVVAHCVPLIVGLAHILSLVACWVRILNRWG